MAKPDVVGEGAEERNTVSNEHRYTSDSEALNQSRAQKLLNRDPAVDVKMIGTAGSES